MFTSAIVTVAVMASACNSGGGASDQKAAGATSGAVGSLAARDSDEVPKLPEKIGKITAEQFMNVVDSVAWRGHTVERQCDGVLARCDSTPGHRSTRVRHEAAAGANNLKFGASLPENGVVVSRMRNLGRHREKLYQLPSGTGEWYAVLTRGTSDVTATLKLVKLDFDQNGRPTLDTTRKPLTVIRCQDGNPNPHPTADAGFKPCDTKPDTAPLFALPNSFNRGAWFTCSLGCCTTGAVPPFGGDSTDVDSAAVDSARMRQRPR
jgi:hypothetical protein